MERWLELWGNSEEWEAIRGLDKSGALQSITRALIILHMITFNSVQFKGEIRERVGRRGRLQTKWKGDYCMCWSEIYS
jgi:hypothetical protein